MLLTRAVLLIRGKLLNNEAPPRLTFPKQNVGSFQTRCETRKLYRVQHRVTHINDPNMCLWRHDALTNYCARWCNAPVLTSKLFFTSMTSNVCCHGLDTWKGLRYKHTGYTIQFSKNTEVQLGALVRSEIKDVMDALAKRLAASYTVCTSILKVIISVKDITYCILVFNRSMRRYKKWRNVS